MDIDVQFKEILQYDTLKELLEIVLKSGMNKNLVNIDYDLFSFWIRFT